MASKPVNAPEINWLQVSKILENCAITWCQHANLPDVFDGVDAKDVVAEAWEAYFGSATQLGWNPHEAPLQLFLWGVCRNKLIDHLRRHMHMRESLDDDTRTASRILTSKQPSPHDRLEAEDSARKFAQQIMIHIDGIRKEPEELKAVVNAAMSIDEPRKINQQLASLTNFSVEKIELIKKRLRRLRPDRSST